MSDRILEDIARILQIDISMRGITPLAQRCKEIAELVLRAFADNAGQDDWDALEALKP